MALQSLQAALRAAGTNRGQTDLSTRNLYLDSEASDLGTDSSVPGFVPPTFVFARAKWPISRAKNGWPTCPQADHARIALHFAQPPLQKAALAVIVTSASAPA